MHFVKIPIFGTQTGTIVTNGANNLFDKALKVLIKHLDYERLMTNQNYYRQVFFLKNRFNLAKWLKSTQVRNS